MAKTDFKSVDEYIRVQPKAARKALRRVRSILRKALPGAKEVISYQMPTYKLQAATVLYFAGWKAHFSLYAASAGVLGAFQKDLAPYQVSKGTIRFPLSEPVPARLIARIAKFRGREALARAKAKLARPTKRRATA